MDIIHEPLIQKRSISVKFSELVEALELALKDPPKAPEYVRDFESKTFEIYLYAEQSIEWLEKQERLGYITESSKASFRISSLMILDRYTELNSYILKGLAQLCVLGGEIGKCAISIVAQTTIISNESETCEILLQVLSPLLEIFENFPIDLKKNLLSSLSKLPCIKELSNCLQPIIQYVISDIIKEPWKTHLCDLFVLLTLDEDNALDISHYPISKFLIRELEQYELKNDMISKKTEKLETIVGFLKVISSSLRSLEPAVLSDFSNSILIPNIKNLIGERVPTTRLSAEESRLGYHFIRLSTSVCQSSDEMLDELCTGFHLFDLLLVPIKETVANLEILTASLEGMCYILYNGSTRDKYSMLITEELDPNIMLTYLEESRREKLIEKYDSEIINNLYLWYYRFIATLMFVSKTNYNMTEFVDKMLNKGLNIHIINNFGFSGCDVKIRCELMNIISQFPDDWIDASIVNKLLNILSDIDIANYHEKELESIVIVLHKRPEYAPMDKLINNVGNLLVATLSIPNSSKYQTLQVKIVKLLLDVAELETARMHLRTENVMLLFLKGLKYEQDYKSLECPDINVELCWTGNNCRFLNMCMFNTYHLKHDRKQFYRALRALERCINGFDAHNNEKTLSFEQLCRKEVEDFYDTASGGYEFNFLEESDIKLRRELQQQNFREVQQHQQISLFINMDLIDKILMYLSPLNSLAFIQYYQYERVNNLNSEYWAGVLKGNKLDYEKMNALPKVNNYSSLYYRFDSNREIAADTRENTRINKSTIDLVTNVISTNLNKMNYELQDCDYFKVPPKPLLNKLYLNEYTKQVNPSLVISSYLRILYGLIDNSDNDIIKQRFKNADFVRNLIKLVTSCNIFDYNLTAKLLKLFIKALTYNISLKAESMDVIVIHDIISNFIELIMKYVVSECILSVNINWIDDVNKHVQYLVLQIVKYVNLVSRQVPLIKFSNIHEIQDYFVEKCLNKFISEYTIEIVMKIFIQLATFQNVTSTGTYTVHLYDTNIVEAIIDNILLIIIQLTYGYSHSKSRDLQFRRYDSISFRSALLTSVLKQIYLHKIKSKFQLFISKAQIERIIIFDESYILTNTLDENANEDNMYLMCISNKNLYLLNYLKDKDDFEILRSFELSKHKLYSIDEGTMYLLHEDTSWVIFSLCYINYDLMKYLCYDNVNILARQLTHHLPDSNEGAKEDSEPEFKNVLATVANYKDHYSLALVSDRTVQIYEIIPDLLVKALYPQADRYTKLLLKTFIKPDARSEMVKIHEPILFLKSVLSIEINKIDKIKFDHHFGIMLYKYTGDESEDNRGSEDDEDRDAYVLNLIGHNNREKFKKFLAKRISNKSWKRSWSREEADMDTDSE
ncbi:conserved hypothetical protein [Theileria orientalis strain Shintoku]|uniref:Uncharacterized protein n=1 Tax=Theileria orientalis strain Shintoku TaxID=869250 RepID=J4CDI6_THEOR|nr:conserved hypothetical protein [Theileria orientalis strain Shintoku]PVC52765.1 hypothetical protein MACL_00000509 [Theileria orientalis]BAM41207.1 conserved hypothetical protein [Theileria orientalis strain Shintoku]|eukprot:XP_009691508.1 conserved hypothetical protein [Theileria orientalis strain Shintoku]